MESLSKKEYTTIIANPTYDKQLPGFRLAVTISNAAGKDVLKLEKSIKEYLAYFNTLQQKGRHYMLFNFPRLIEYSEELDYDECVTIAGKIRNTFDEIFDRQDILNDEISLAFLDGLQFIKSDKFPIKLLQSNQLSQGLNASDMFFDPFTHGIYYCADNSSALSRVGRVWSLIEPEVMGSLKLYKLKATDYSAPLEKVFSRDFENRSHKFLYSKERNTIYVGFNDGALINMSYPPDKPNEMKYTTYTSGTDPIIGMHFIDGDIFVVTPVSVKMISPEAKIIGGGSLKKRLGSENLTCAAVDAKNKLIMLGTSKGTIHLYTYEKSDTYQLVHNDSFVAQEGGSVECIALEKNNILVGSKLDLMIFTYKYVSKKFSAELISQFAMNSDLVKKRFSSDDVITNVCFVAEKRLLITSYSNGAVIFWSSDTAEILGVLRAHDDRVVKILYKANVLFTLGYSSELRLWKMKDE